MSKKKPIFTRGYQESRERLAKNMGTSNYYFYLDANINSKASRGF